MIDAYYCHKCLTAEINVDTTAWYNKHYTHKRTVLRLDETKSWLDQKENVRSHANYMGVNLNVLFAAIAAYNT